MPSDHWLCLCKFELLYVQWLFSRSSDIEQSNIIHIEAYLWVAILQDFALLVFLRNLVEVGIDLLRLFSPSALLS